MYNDDDLAPLVEDYFRSGAAREDMEATMFVRINTQHAVNMDNVTELYLTHSAGISGSQTAIIINFTADTPLTIYADTDGFEALKTWMGQLPLLAGNDEEFTADDFLCPLKVIMEDAPLHRDSNSLCSDMTCPCWAEEF